jgi:hypothetical protein
MNKTGQAPHRSRPSAKPKKEYFIAGIVIVEDELVTLQHVSAKTRPESVASKFAPVGPQALIVKNDLVLGPIFEQAEQFINIGIMTLAAFLTRSIRKDDDILSHDILLLSGESASP